MKVRRALVPVLCLVQFVDVMGVTVVVTALPEMLRTVGAGPGDADLLATAYATFFGGLLVFGARVGDRVGYRRTIEASLGLFAVGNLSAALASSVGALVAARCLQGAAAAGAVPAALRLITSAATAEPAKSRAVAAWSASGAAAGAGGFVVGGVVTDLASWRDIYWALLAVAVVLVVVVRAVVPADRDKRGPRPINITSSAVLTLAVMSLVVATTLLGEPSGRPAGAALVGVALVLAVLLWRTDPRSPAPLLPGALLARPTLVRGALGGWLNTATTSSAAALLTLYLQDARGDSPLTAAATLVPFSVAVVLGSSLASPLLGRLAAERVSAVGLGTVAFGDGLLAVLAGHGAAIALCTALAGLGIGLSSVATTSLGTSVPEQERATASGVINTTAQLGTALGVALVLLVAAVTTGLPSPHAPAPAWLCAAGLAALGAGIFTVFRPLPRSTPADGLGPGLARGHQPVTKVGS